VTGHPFLDHPGPIPFAHRGGAGDLPENTLVAFEAAIRLGYRYVETDVHATVDGVLLAFHDDRLDRVTDRTGRIADLPFTEVARARVAGREPIPRLEELLAAWPELRVNVDPKDDTTVRPLIEVVRRTGAIDRICVGSFSGRRLTRVRAALGPRLCTSLGPRGVAALRGASWRVPGLARLVGAEGAACVQIPVRQGRLPIVDRRFVRAAHGLGLPVHVWTVDDPAEMEALLDLGVDGLMTDRPAILRDVLSARGLWVPGPTLR
jgi:glycerophosphoryl diester phosphodiesterase